jgi:hypothetical protein
MKRDKKGRFMKESSINFKHITMSKLLLILGYSSLTIALLGLMGYIVECTNPEFTRYGKIAAGAASFGIYLVIFVLLREETRGIFNKKKSNRPFKDKVV